MKNLFRFALAINVLSLVLLSQSKALCDEAYSNLGPNDSFDASQGYLVGTFDQLPNVHIGFQFTAEATGTIDSIDAALSLFNDAGSDSVIFNIWTAETDVPDTLIWSGSTQVTSGSPEIYNATVQDFTGGASLTSGFDYWVTARSATATNAYVWYFNDQGDFPRGAFDLDGGTNWLPIESIQAGAFRVNVSAVPEPTSGLLAGLLAMAGLTRRSRKA